MTSKIEKMKEERNLTLLSTKNLFSYLQDKNDLINFIEINEINHNNIFALKLDGTFFIEDLEALVILLANTNNQWRG